MFRTAVLMTKKRSLALSVHFKQPDFGMEEYEILSRASAFLVFVDPPEPEKAIDRYSFLEESVEQRQKLIRRQGFVAEPAGGPRRNASQLGWLEFCPTICRPRVHCFASSHVLAPWLWPKYYTQEWLKDVKQEHCTYTLEVYDDTTSVAKVALSPFVIHHPNNLDIGIIHLKDEETTLGILKNLNVEIFDMRDEQTNLEANERVSFDGFSISETDNDKLATDQTEDDNRVFYPFVEPGKLIYKSPERFLASTQRPLPEGMCGCPVIDKSGKIAGMVEGIVPLNHQDKNIAAAACFLPLPLLKEFTDASERFLLQQIVPDDLFQEIVTLKGDEDTEQGKDEVNMDEDVIQHDLDNTMTRLKEHHSTDEVEAINATIQREKDEVLEILAKEGGDMDEIIALVRKRTLETREAISELLEKAKQESMPQEEVSKKIDDIMKKAGSKTFAQQERLRNRNAPRVGLTDE